MIYPFFCASLPTLLPGVPPELSVEDFDASAQEYLSAADFAALMSIDSKNPAEYSVEIYRKLREFQDYLKWKIALLRSERLKRSDRFTPPDEFFGEVDFAIPILAAAEPVEREKLLDALIFQKLDELEIFHEMDLTALCIYRLKLGILQKYAKWNEINGKNNFEAALEKLAADFNEL